MLGLLRCFHKTDQQWGANMTSEIIADHMSHRSLKSKQRQIRENFLKNLGLRVHRALS